MMGYDIFAFRMLLKYASKLQARAMNLANLSCGKTGGV